MPAIIATAILGEALAAEVAFTAFGASVTYGVIGRVLVTVVLSKLMMDGANSNQRTNDGSRVQLPPATNNRLPVSYGTAWLRPVITDALISTDQKTMWYVLSYAEVPDASSGFGGGTLSFGDIRWGDKTLNFDPTIATRVVSWTTTSDTPQTDTRVNDKIHVYMYTNGSLVSQNSTQTAIQVLQDSGIATENRWASTDLMTKTAFLIVRVDYDQNIGLTGIDQISAEVINTLKDPGGVIYDYLTNDRYGCAILPANVDSTSLQNLTTYSNQLITYTPQGGGSATQIRYAINGPVDTGKDCYQNLATITDACDSWLQWNEATAKWGVVINKGYDQSPNALTLNNLFNLNDDNVIGSINLQPVDLNSTYNRVEVNYPDTNIYDQSGFAYIDLDNGDRNPNEPDNVLNLQLPVVNNNVQAKYIATRKLIQSREDLNVTVTVDYSGIQIDAGDVVRFNNSKYQWVDKLFRVTQVTESKDEQDSLNVSLNLVEYNPQVYENINISQFIPSPNTGVTDPNIATTPSAPTVSGSQPSADVPTFNLNVTIPTSGSYGTLELWISSDADSSDLTKYTLLKTLLPGDSAAFTPGSSVVYAVTGLGGGNYYFRARVITATGSRSDYSPASTQFGWVPTFPGASTIAIDYNPDFYALSVGYGNTTVTGQSLPIVLSVLNGTSLTPYSTSSTDAGMANDSWRVISISKNDVVLANDTPTTNTTSATWTLTGATQTTSSPATLAASIRYKKNTSNYTDLTQTFNVSLIQAGAPGPQGNTGNAGAAGNTASSIDISGITTFSKNSGGAYTPTTANLVALTTNITSPSYLWAITGATPTASGNINVVIAPNQDATSITANLTVSGTNLANSISKQVTLAIVQNGANGQAGSNGVMSAFPSIYQWTNSSTPPARPGTAGTYYWATGTWTVESGPWSTSPPSNTTAGYYLWSITVPLTVTATTTTSTADWTDSANSVRAISYNGVNGINGNVGNTGAAGSSGSATFVITRSANDSSPPSNAEVTAVIGRNPVAGDIVTVSYNSANNAVIYRYTTSWTTQATYLTGSLIVDGTITGAKISGSTITSSNLVGNTITGDKLASTTITGDKIATGTITANNISSNYVYAGTIYANQISANTLSTITSNTGNLNVTGTIAVSTGASTANGVIMDSNGISIYNSGVLRVRLGTI